jgi:hypothetical protein
MKFPQLPIGQRFLFRGEAFVKAGPLTARREKDGDVRLMPRSALVELPRPPAAGGTVEPEGMPQRLSRALAAYERALRSVLLAPAADLEAHLQGRLDAGLVAGRRAFQDSLAQSEEPAIGA